LRSPKNPAVNRRVFQNDDVDDASEPLLELAALEHTKHDCADKGEGDVSGHYAEFADERTKGHGNAPKVTSLPAVTLKPSNRFQAKKVSFAVHPFYLGGASSMATWLKSREIKMLMSP
jgi:hypothetical protein